MLRISHSLGRLSKLIAASAALCSFLLHAGCERKDPLAERKFHLLLEENARLTAAVTALDPSQSGKKSSVPTEITPENAGKLSAENDRLREILTQSERQKALAANKKQREEIERATVAIRGLKFLSPVDYSVLSRKQIRQTISGKLAEVFSEQEFKNMTEAMAAIGLLPPGYPLREKYIDLLGEQVAAFYDQHTHKLFMYEDASLDNAQNRVILSHELTHALQDQHFGLRRMPLEIKNNDDRANAASALVEGDATLVMSEYMLKNMSRQMFKDSMTASFSQNMSQLATAPRYLREMLVFPYLRGQEFCAALFARGGYEAISKAYASPPTSTAQILHPEKYLATPREDPIAIEWSSLSVKGEKPIADNTVGEMGIRILFTEWVDALTGEQAAEGWRGDRYLYYAGGKALLWKSVWATAKDASEFFEAEKKLLEKRDHPTAPRSGEHSYEADAPRSIRLRQTDANEVILIDAANADWAKALEDLK
jgi:hypothetical protein